MPLRSLVVSILAAALLAAEPYDPAILGSRAAASGLGEDVEWLTLLHVDRAWYGRRRSLVDDPAFFLAPGGKTDPTAELMATIRAVLAPPSPGTKHAVDRFPARFEFLIRRLGLERARLPVPQSREFEEAYAGLGPRSAAIAFPTAYMNTPASLFGHTLLVVRSRVRTGMGSQAINYAALAGQDGGVAFALKGVFGGYPGHFSLQPYWTKLNEYSDLDQRDVWEYELDLGAEDLRRVLLHVWEMRGINADYWFFDENCALLLLYLLDAAKPELQLHAQAPPWVIPLDTVRILRQAGLVTGVSWRPSLATKVRTRASGMPPEQAELARSIALGEQLPAAAGTDAAAAGTLDLAVDYLQALRNRRKVDQPTFQGRFMPMLQARSRLGVAPAEDPADPGDVPPDLGHGSLRVGFGGGFSGHAGFVEYSVRPAYHDLLDPLAGFVPGAQIEFCGVVLRSYEGEAKPKLERFDAIGLRSFTPRDRFFAPPSWKVDTGLIRERSGANGGAEQHVYVDFGVGGCWSLPNRGMVYAMLDADLREVDRDPSLALGLGPEVGLLLPLGDRVTINPQARWESFIGELPGDNWQIGVRGRVTIHRDLAVAMELWRKETWDFQYTQFGVRVLAYF